MKAFKKWWKKKYKADFDEYKPIGEAGWKAALEWVKSQSDEAKNLYMIDVNDMERELEE